MARRYFGTDGVRGVVGEVITPELVERLGRAATLWSGRAGASSSAATRARRASSSRTAFARGVVSAGGAAVRRGVLPTPAVALLALDLGVVISASHNPPEYNGVKFFDAGGRKLPDESEEQIEQLLAARAGDRPGQRRPGRARDRLLPSSTSSSDFGSDLSGLRIARRLRERRLLRPRAAGVRAARRRGRDDRQRARRDEHQRRVRRDRHGRVAGAGDERGFDLGIAFDGDGDRMLAVDERGQLVDGDQIVAILALHLDVDTVAVTQMTNLGFHTLMRERGIRVSRPTSATATSSRRSCARAPCSAASSRATSSGSRATSPATGSRRRCSSARPSRAGSCREAAAVMPRFRAGEGERPRRAKVLTPAIEAEVEAIARELGESGRVLVTAVRNGARDPRARGGRGRRGRRGRLC